MYVEGSVRYEFLFVFEDFKNTAPGFLDHSTVEGKTITRKRNKGRRPTLLSNNCFNFSNNSDNTLKAMPDKDPYVALGLQRGASAKDIKKACKWWDVLDRCVLSVLVGACRCLLVVLACDACVTCAVRRSC